MKIRKIVNKSTLLCMTVFMLVTTIIGSITPIRASSENVVFESYKAEEVIAEAQKHIGKPYVWGAAGPSTFDCSGYVSYVFKQVGLKFNADRFTTNTLESYLNGMSVTNYRYNTNESNPINAKRGDIIFYYDETGDPMHMGIYLGNGQIIHCAASMPSGPQNQVMISGVDALGSKHGTSIVSYKVYRVFPDSGGVRLKKTDEFGNALAGVTFKITYPNGTVRNIVTDANGIWDTDALGIKPQVGIYQYQEISTIEGYVLDSTVKTFQIRAGVKADANIVVVTNKEPSGEIKIIKTNTNGDRVGNTTFNVYADETIRNKAGTKVHYSKDQLVATLTTNSTGEITSPKIPLGKYRIVETQVPNGYILNTQIYSVELKYKDQVTSVITSSTTIANEDQKGTIILKKFFDTLLVDGKIGDGFIEGNQYALIAKERITNIAGTIEYYQKDQVVSYKTTDSEGMITWDDLPLGQYYALEIKSNNSTQLNPNPIDIALNYAGQTVQKAIVNQATSNKLNMQKIQVFKSGLGGEAGIYNGLENVEFTFKLKSDVDQVGWDNAQVYDIITTDKNGNAVTKYLPYGEYHVKETKTPNDYTPAPDFTVTITKNYASYSKDEQIKKVNVNNSPLSAQVKLVKVDDDTGETITLNSASFKIKDSKGNYVIQKVGGIKIDTFTTNSKNQIISIFGKDGEVTLPLKLRAGEYTIEEIKIPTGFLELEEPVKFTIENIRDMEMDEDQEPLVTVKIKNKQPKGSLTIQKTDKETMKPLMDVEYTLTAKKDIINMIDGTVLFKAGDVVKEGSTDVEGYIKIDNLFMGEYELKESLTNEGYVLSNKVHDIVFTQNDTTTKHYTVHIDAINIKPTGNISLVKIDENTKELLSGVIYQLTAKEDIISLDGRNTVLYKAGESVSVDISEEGHYMTSELGEIHIADLPLGVYELKEVQALDGYATDRTVYEIDLSYDGSDKVVYAQTLGLTNQKTKVNILKVDASNDKPLTDATLVLKDEETGEIIEEWISKEETKTFIGLSVGKRYILHEAKAPKGYHVASDIMFTIEDSEDVQIVVMKDTKISKTVQTGDMSGLMPIIYLLIASGVVLVITEIIIRKKNKDDK